MLDHVQPAIEEADSGAVEHHQLESATSRTLRVLTIGHSNFAPGEFLALLKLHGVQVVVDVRSAPYSRFAPQFNRATLAASLGNVRIEPRRAGDYLGGRPPDPT